MSFPNEHVARLKESKRFVENSLERVKVAEGIDLVSGKIEGEAVKQPHSYLISTEVFTAKDAIKWLSDTEVEYTGFTPASSAVSFKHIPRADLKAIETVDITDVEIARIGSWPGNYGGKKVPMITGETFNEMKGNYEGKVVEPFLNLDHDDDFTDNVKRALKVVSLGFVSKLNIVGDRLMANFKQVPRKVAELIKSGMLKKRSIEWYPSYELNGKQYKNVLRAVSFFGADVPAINDLSDDFNVLLKSDQKNALAGSGKLAKISFKENSMDTVEITKDEHAEFVSLKSVNADLSQKNEASSQEVVSLKKEKDDLLKVNEDLKKENETLVKFKKEVGEQSKISLKKEAEDFIDKAIEEGKILVKFKETYVEDYIAKSSSEESIALFKEDIENRTKVVNLGEYKNKKSVGKVDMQSATAEQIQEAIDAEMEATGCSFAEADKKVTGG